MESTSCLKAVVSAATLYRNNPSESQIVQLQRQLDVLISITSKQHPTTPLCDVFSPTNLLVTECFASLLAILGEMNIKYSLAEKILLLFMNLCKDAKVCNSLHHTFHVTPCLATFLCQNVTSPTDSNALLCVKLLQKVTYHGKVHSSESFVENLMKFLIRRVQGKESEMLLPSLGLMANLLRQNFGMQTLVKNMENMKSLCKCLISYLSQPTCNKTVSIFCLSVLTSLCIHDELGDMLFNGKNIHQTFHLIFSILVKGDGDTRTYAVDLFLDMLRYSRLQNSLIIYPNLTSCMHRVLLLLCDKDEESVCKILDLLLALCCVDEIRALICQAIMDPPQSLLTAAAASSTDSSLPDPFSALLHWIAMEHTAIPALRLVKEVYEKSVELGLSASVPLRIEEIVPRLTALLSLPASTSSFSPPPSPRKIAHALHVLIILCEDDSLKPQVSQSVDAKLCTSLVEWQFAANMANQNTTTTDSVSEDGGEEKRGGVEVVLYTLQLMMQLSQGAQSMHVSLVKLLQDERVAWFLCCGLSSSDRELVQITIAALTMGASLKEFPKNELGDTLAAQNGHCRSSKKSPTDHSLSGVGGVGDGDSPSPYQRHPFTTSHKRPRMTDIELEESVSCIIEQMSKGGQLKDVRTSDMISVYEVSLQSQKVKESHLQDLLEAKTQALEQADRLIAQYRNRRAHEEAKAHQLRLIVKTSERNCEELREQRNELLVERDQLRNDVEQLQQDNNRLENVAEDFKELSEKYREQTQKFENMQRSFTALKQEHQSLSDMHEMLRRRNETLKQQHDTASEQLAELDEERKLLSRQLKEKEQRATEVSKSLKKTEERLKRVEKDRDQLNMAIDKLRDNLASTENQKKDLLHQVTSLEVVCRQHEAAIREKEELITQQRHDIDKHAQVAAMIRNLTSGVSPTDLANK